LSLMPHLIIGLGMFPSSVQPPITGPVSAPPQGPPLPPLFQAWTADEFVQIIRTGVDPSGDEIDPEQMPWLDYAAAFTDDEMIAMYEYIRALPAQRDTAAR
jgi:hypothetical protein